MRTPRRLRRTFLPLLIAAVLASLPVIASPASAATVDGSEVVGAPCDPGVGVTVVVDFTELLDEIHIGCAPGERANGHDALVGAGFTVNDDGMPVGGALCQVDGLPAEGYPYCWATGGFWSYWGKTPTTDWAFATVGGGGGAPRQIDSIEGWSWAHGFSSAAPRIDETIDLDAPVVEITSAPAATTDSRDATFEFTVDDVDADTVCTIDDGAAEPCSSPHEVAGLDLQEHTFTVTATDGVGNTGTASHTWTIQEATAPDTCATDIAGVGGPDEGLDWLACELDAAGGLFGSVYDDVFYTDVGMTLDALMAFGINDRGDDPAVAATFAALAPEMESYINGFGDPTDRVAGGTSKALLTSYVTTGGGSSFGSFDLEGDLRGLLTADGDQAGRFQDRNAWGDYSNGFSQALAILALSHTEAGVPEPALDFLLDQQCPSGGFRGVYENTRGCESDANADTDYTAMALQALLTSPDVDDVDEATEATITWLLGRRDAATGAFGGTGITAELNTNSSGLIAQGLRAAGSGEVADGAAAWIADLQLAGASTADSPAAADLGAYAYGPAAFDEAIAVGIDEFARSQWQRATTQAVLAFGAPMFGKVNRIDGTTEPSISLSAVSAKVGEQVTITATGFVPGEEVTAELHSTPQPLGTATADADGAVSHSFTVPTVEVGAHRVVLEGSESGLVLSTALEVLAADAGSGDPVPTTAPQAAGTDSSSTGGTGTGSGTLARTGSGVTGAIPFALALLVAGAFVLAVNRRRAPAHAVIEAEA